MCILAALRRLSSACAVFFGPHGAVSQKARLLERSRQSLYREAAQVLDQVEGAADRQRLAQAQEALDACRARLAELERRLAEAVEVSEDQLAEFAATAQAVGLSLTPARQLLAVLLRRRTPSRARLGRLAAAAAVRAGAALAVADAALQPRVERAAADEIYCGRKAAVLMAVAPDSLCWLAARRTAHLTGQAWAAELGRWPQLNYLVSDAGSQLRKGVADLRAARQEARGPALRHAFDVFHVLREGQAALRRTWRAVTRKVEQAERRQRAFERRRRRGRSQAAGERYWSGRAWQAAEQALDQASATERAWQQVRSALGLFTPQGALQGRAQAEASVAAALPQLVGAHWGTARGLLGRPETFAFLDEAQAQVDGLGLAPATRRALLDLEGLRRQPERLRGESPQAAAARGLALARGVQLAKSEPTWPEQAEALRRALRRAWRASSLVECLNSVVRMQQGRHRRLTQGLLDLKRWFWNCRPFRTGRRRKRTPYELLGLRLPPGSWWELLKLSPEQLRERLSAQRDAA
jgi:hypothetical protein